MKTLEERIAALEKTNRRWRYGTAASLLVGSTIALMGAQKGDRNHEVADLIRTRQIEVVRENGKPLLVLGRVAVKIQKGKLEAANIEVDGISLLDNAGNSRMAVMLPQGPPRARSEGAAIIMLNEHGKPMVMLYDEHGIGGELDICTSDGQPAVGITGTHYETRKGDAWVYEKGGAIGVFDSDGQLMGSLGDPRRFPSVRSAKE